MKKLVCIICTLALCVSMLSGTLFSSALMSSDGYIKVIGDFETAAKIAQFTPQEYYYFGQTVTTDTSNYATGTQGAKITLVNSSPGGLAEVVWNPGSTYDLSGADYLQFYVKNSGAVSVGFNCLGTNAFVVSAATIGQIPVSGQAFWSQHYGSVYYAGAHDFTALPALVYSNGSWVPALTTGVTGYSSVPMAIPAGYEGFVRIPLSSAEKVVNNYGIAFQLMTNDTNAAGLTLSIDDFAVVATSDKSADNTYTTFANYMSSVRPYYVKVISDFENATKVSQFIPTEWTGYFHQTITADTSNYATGTQGTKITLVTANTSSGAGRVVWSPGSGTTIDMSGADYVQFYVKNSGIVPLAITNLGLSAFAVTADNVNQTDNPTFWSQHLGALYYVTTHNFTALPALVYSNNSWVAASRADVTGFPDPAISIPAGYEGFIRIPLSSAEKVSNSYGIGFDIGTTDANAAGLTLSIDDFALVTTIDKSFDNSYTTFSNYLNSVRPYYVKVVGDFESAAKVSQFIPTEWTGFFNQTITADTSNYATGTQGAKITLVTASPNDGLGRVVWSPGATIDMSDADYVQFYVKNSGIVPLAITNLGLSAFAVTADNVNQTDNPTFWSQHLGALYYVTTHDFNALPALVYSNNSWIPASRADVPGFANPGITIPAGYEGFIRVPLSAAEKTSNSYGIGFDIATKDANAAGLTLSIDDFALVTTADKSSDNSYTSINSYLNDQVIAHVFKSNYAKNNIMTNIQPGKTIRDFMQGITINGNVDFIFKDSQGNILYDDNTIGTGATVDVYNGSVLTNTYTFLMYGDVNGDGKVDLNDLVAIRDSILGVHPISDIYETAGDLYGENGITLNDLVGVMANISGLGNINQNHSPY